MNEFYYLSHGGPGSGRYPLGSGERPYQKFEKSRTRRSSSLSSFVKKRREKKVEEEKNKQKKVAEEAAERKRQHDEDKERVLRQGSASEVLKYKGELTNQELQNAVSRIRLENDLKSMSSAEIKTNVEKFDKIMKNVKTGTDWIRTATDAYNTLAAIYNATPEGQKKPLSYVGKGGSQPKQDKK